MSLERAMYTNPATGLILIARKTAEDLKRHYGLAGPFPVVYIGLDKEIFNPELRLRNRPTARAHSVSATTFLPWCWSAMIGRRRGSRI